MGQGNSNRPQNESNVMNKHPSATQLTALKAMAVGPLIRNVIGWHSEDGIPAGRWSISTLEACSRAGWCRVTAYGNHRSKASITQAGRDALRTISETVTTGVAHA